jgi:hypothetical protein
LKKQKKDLDEDWEVVKDQRVVAEQHDTKKHVPPSHFILKEDKEDS